MKLAILVKHVVKELQLKAVRTAVENILTICRGPSVDFSKAISHRQAEKVNIK